MKNEPSLELVDINSSLVLTICHIIRLYKCEHCTLTYSNKITLVWFLHFFFYLGGRLFSKILHNIWGWCVKILTIPYRGGWVVRKRPKTPLRNIKMAPYRCFSPEISGVIQKLYIQHGLLQKISPIRHIFRTIITHEPLQQAAGEPPAANNVYFLHL